MVPSRVQSALGWVAGAGIGLVLGVAGLVAAKLDDKGYLEPLMNWLVG